MILEEEEEEGDWWYQDLQFKLFQAFSGQFLAVSENLQQPGVRRVVSTEVERGVWWRVDFSRPSRQSKTR